jgi:lipopolysaccharide export system protein LptA
MLLMMRNGIKVGWVTAAAICLYEIFAPVMAVGQTTSSGFRAFVFYTDAELEPGQTNRLKTIISGDSMQMLTNGLFDVKNPRIEHFGPKRETNLIAVSPQCFFDGKRNTIQSTNVLKAHSATNEMRIEGRGYFGMLTNLYLIFSNDVTTVIRQEVAQSARAPGSLLGARTSTRTNAPLAVTNSDVHITADLLHLNYQNNLATYYRNVEVQNAQVVLTSEQLEIKRSKTNNIESILAKTNVVVRHKFEPSEASGDRAHYFLENGQEVLELSGSPAKWREGQRAGKAGRFHYQLGERILLAENDAMFRFPRGALSQTDWLPGRAAAPKTNAPPASTNEFLEVHGHMITSWLSTSNRPGNRMLAETNVLILGSGDQTRAAAHRATYNEQVGEMDLLGNAEWQQGLRTVKGEHLHYDRTNQVFTALGNAYLKVPVAEFGQQAKTNSAPGTNRVRTVKGQQFVETFSDHFEYRGGYLTFYENVRATLLESNVPRGELTTPGYVKLKMSNQIERIIARNKVHVEQFPQPTLTGKAVSKKLDCEALTVDLRTNGWIYRVLAQTNVVAQQTRKASAKAKPSYSRMTAESVFAEFFSHTNDVREIIAERDVFLMQDNRTAIGQKAVYTATNNLVELTGNPSIDAPEIRLDKADAIIWNRAQDRFYFRTPSGQAEPPKNAEKGLRGSK